jgi:hypothetical protein
MSWKAVWLDDYLFDARVNQGQTFIKLKLQNKKGVIFHQVHVTSLSCERVCCFFLGCGHHPPYKHFWHVLKKIV